MSKLVIVVPVGRRHCGRLMLLGDDGSTRLGPLRVLATASGWAARRHGNATRDWRRPFGHLPCGSYVIAGSLPPGVGPRPRRARRFGALGALVLAPSGGDAKEAAGAGRRSFLLHGGPPDAKGRLRPTFGGARLLDRDLAALLRAINGANAVQDPVSAVEVAEIANPSWTTHDAARERAGRLRPAVASNQARTARGGPLGHAALVTLGFGLLGRRGRAAVGKGAGTGRRDFVGLALLTLGAIGGSACLGAGPDVPADDLCRCQGAGASARRRARPSEDAGATSNADAGAAANGPSYEQDGGGPCGGYGACGGDVAGGGGAFGGGDVAGGDVAGGDVGGGDDTGGDNGGDG